MGSITFFLLAGTYVVLADEISSGNVSEQDSSRKMNSQVKSAIDSCKMKSKISNTKEFENDDDNSVTRAAWNKKDLGLSTLFLIHCRRTSTLNQN